MSARKVLEKVGIRQVKTKAGRFSGIEETLRSLHLELASAKTEVEVVRIRGLAMGTLDAARMLGYPEDDYHTQSDKLKRAVKEAFAVVNELEKGKAEKARSVAVVEMHRAKVERDFWVEQSRQLQNQLQQSQALNANLTEFLFRTGQGITPDDIRAMLADLTAALREPVVGVEAVRALTAQLSGKTQGSYTPVDAPRRKKLLAGAAKA